MKNRLMAWVAAAVMLIMPCTQTVRAQVFDGPEPQSSLISSHLSLGRIVGCNAAYDYALARVWKGTFTIGGQLNYMWDDFDQHKTPGMHSLNAMVRTTYRFNVLVPAWEVYGGVGLGGGAWFTKNQGFGIFAYSFILGTGYYFTPNIGVDLELDLGSSAGGTRWTDLEGKPHIDSWSGRAFMWPWLNLGITFRL